MAFLCALVVLAVGNVVLFMHCCRAELKVAFYREERNRYRQLALRGLAEMEVAIRGAAAKQV
jgi:hypothetical protein